MPYTKIYIHIVWGTKSREKFITPELKPKLLQHIREIGVRQNIFIDTLNCMPDHVHLLISLHPTQNIAEVVKLIKGASAFWVNKEKLTKAKFRWQAEYYAASVSYYGIEDVRGYIVNQERHHAQNKLTKELEPELAELETPV